MDNSSRVIQRLGPLLALEPARAPQEAIERLWIVEGTLIPIRDRNVEPAERGKTFLLAMPASTGLSGRIAGGTDAQSVQVGFGRAAELLSRERVASKQSAAAMREPLTRTATAAAPLMRCSDPAVVTATKQLLNALSEVENTARLVASPEAFGRPGNAATAPRLSWWARRRAVHTT
jgi:hypothetical protein